MSGAAISASECMAIHRDAGVQSSFSADQYEEGARQLEGPVGPRTRDSRRRAPRRSRLPLSGAGIDGRSQRQPQRGAAAKGLADKADAVGIHVRQRCQMVESGMGVADLQGVVLAAGLAAIGDAACPEAVDDERDVAVVVQQSGRDLIQASPDRLMRRVSLEFHRSRASGRRRGKGPSPSGLASQDVNVSFPLSVTSEVIVPDD